MKYLASLLLMLLSTPSVFAFEAKDLRFRCMTELPSTTFELKTISLSNKSQTTLTMTHHMGSDYAPIQSGVILASDLPSLKDKSDLIKKLGDELVLKFDSNACSISGPGLYSCASRNALDLNGVSVSGFGFSTRVVETKIYEETFKSHQINFYFIHQGISYDIPMSYSEQECTFAK